ncbi:ATP-binding protein [Nocardiopsis salina]|uniref:ATP-binding protein n=1 Tax=Nocardiopsis salina TaxID=245836 RepID=UPI000A0228F9|nr:ATP-binding protein [Nocardiopsis salina]
MSAAHPLPRRVPGYSNGELRRGGRRHAAVFSSSSHAAAGARRWARQVTGFPPAEASMLELVTSELVSNALQHTASGRPGGFFTIKIAFMTPSCLRLEVTDGGPRVTDKCSFPDWGGGPVDSDHGRGLAIVGEVSRRTGVLGVVGGPLTVWAILDRADLR